MSVSGDTGTILLLPYGKNSFLREIEGVNQV